MLSPYHLQVGKVAAGLNEDESAAIFCCLVAALILDMFCNFLVKSHKIANNSATTEAREKPSTVWESLQL
jgi:hypothetical protein